MTVIKKTIEIKNNIDIEDNEINVYNHESNKNIIKYLNTYIDKININEKILYFSFYNSSYTFQQCLCSFSHLRSPNYYLTRYYSG